MEASRQWRGATDRRDAVRDDESACVLVAGARRRRAGLDEGTGAGADEPWRVRMIPQRAW